MYKSGDLAGHGIIHLDDSRLSQYWSFRTVLIAVFESRGPPLSMNHTHILLVSATQCSNRGKVLFKKTL